MPDISRESCEGVFCQNREEAEKHGPGAFWYWWDEDVPEEKREFPRDVRFVYIVMPVRWSQVYEHDAQRKSEILPEYDRPVPINWATHHPKNAVLPHHWQLTGTPRRPTLHPSLYWTDVWHGWLQDGYLRSC